MGATKSGSRKVTSKGRKGVNQAAYGQRTYSSIKNSNPRKINKKLGTTRSKTGHFSKVGNKQWKRL